MIHVTINGKLREIEVQDHESLADVLPELTEYDRDTGFLR